MTEFIEQLTIEKIAVPIFVAILTTLIVEYFAKPRLEARKSRLLRDRQQFDKIVFCFQRISASIGSLPTADQANQDKVFRKFVMIMLDESRAALYELLKEMSQLSSIYAVSHKEHIGKTMKYVGFLLAKVELCIEDNRKISISELKELAESLELFDVYYLVYVYMYDSQESSVKRLIWRMFRRKSNDAKIDSLFDKYKITSSKAAK